MKRKIVVFWVLIFWAFHGDIRADGPFVKLGRGLTNIVMAPAEIFMQPLSLAKDYDDFTAFSGGIFKGITLMFLRQLSGIYETATFPIPIPKGYRPLWEPNRFPPTTTEAFRREYGTR